MRARRGGTDPGKRGHVTMCERASERALSSCFVTQKKV